MTGPSARTGGVPPWGAGDARPGRLGRLDRPGAGRDRADGGGERGAVCDGGGVTGFDAWTSDGIRKGYVGGSRASARFPPSNA